MLTFRKWIDSPWIAIGTEPEGEGDSNGGGGGTEDEFDRTKYVSVDEVAGLKSALNKLKAENARLKPIDKILSDQGLTLDQIQELRTQAQVEEQIAARAAEIEARSQAKIEEETAHLRKLLSETNQRLERQTVERSLAQVYAELGGQPGGLQDFMNLAASKIKVNPQTGVIESIASPEDGKPWFKATADNNSVKAGVADFAAAVNEGKFGVALRALLTPPNRASGAGMGTSFASSVIDGRIDFTGMTPAEIAISMSSMSDGDRKKVVDQSKSL